MSALTPKQLKVLTAIEIAEKPVTAYQLLDQLSEEGFRAPPQVYRALNALLERGLVHRLSSRNAYVACSHRDCAARSIQAFTVCVHCDRVTELADRQVQAASALLLEGQCFTIEDGTLELIGCCAACAGP